MESTEASTNNNENVSKSKTKETSQDIRRFTIQFDRNAEAEYIDKIESLVDATKQFKQSKRPNLSDIIKMAIDRISLDDIEQMADGLLTPKEKFESKLRKLMIEEGENKDCDVYEFLMTNQKAKTLFKKLQ